MKILLVANFAPPQNNVAVSRIHSWVRDWSRSGHNVTLLTTKKVLGLDGKLDGADLLKDSPSDNFRLIEVPYSNVSGILENSGPSKKEKSIRQKIISKFRQLFPFLLDRRATWLFRSVRELNKILDTNSFDIIVSSFPISYAHMIAYFVAKKLKIPWLADYRDPWSCDTMRRGPWPFYLVDYFLEKHLIKRATRITAVSPGQAEMIGTWLNRKVDVIYNGSDDASFGIVNEFRSANKREKISIRYLGSIYDFNQHAYLEFFAALKNLCELNDNYRKKLAVEFIGNRSHLLEPHIKAHGLNDIIKCLPIVSMPQAINLMTESDILLFFDLKRELKVPGTLSGKIFEYFAARRPILSICNDTKSDVNRLIDVSQSGTFFDFGSSDSSLDSCFKQLLQMIDQGKPNYQALSEYRRQNQSMKALCILEEAVTQRGFHARSTSSV